jgi:hypothetical protein
MVSPAGASVEIVPRRDVLRTYGPRRADEKVPGVPRHAVRNRESRSVLTFRYPRTPSACARPTSSLTSTDHDPFLLHAAASTLASFVARALAMGECEGDRKCEASQAARKPSG